MKFFNKKYTLVGVTMLFNQNCLDVLKKVPDNSFSSIVTDPPYGISFMDKSWDKTFPKKEVWAEILRVARPGAFLLCFGSPRTYHRITCAIEDAGWIIRDCLMWLYVSGMPKGCNIGKVVDKKLGSERPVIGAGSPEASLWEGHHTGLKPAYEPIVVAMKPCEKSFAANALDWNVAGLNVEECRVSGRHPANVILEEGAEILDEKRSRIFYCTKAGKKEKEAGLEDLPDKIVSDGRLTPNDTPYLRDKTMRKNTHPTVKPIDLMRYLCRLTRQNGEDWVLDPFMGSGSTGVAALKEGRKFCGIEINEEYFKIAEKRVEHERQKLSRTV